SSRKRRARYRRRCLLFYGYVRTCHSARGLCAGHRLESLPSGAEGRSGQQGGRDLLRVSALARSSRLATGLGLFSTLRERGNKAGPCEDWIRVINPKSPAGVVSRIATGEPQPRTRPKSARPNSLDLPPARLPFFFAD